MGVTGASGAILSPAPDESCSGAEIHLILSRSGEKTLFLETGKKAADLKSLADHPHGLVVERSRARLKLKFIWIGIYIDTYTNNYSFARRNIARQNAGDFSAAGKHIVRPSNNSVNAIIAMQHFHKREPGNDG